ncbi:MAG: EpsG family protein, partial [Gammaproteobacteria bacterium]|nr:EpsG family protein [Gammaproteobacteria bacterium]
MFPYIAITSVIGMLALVSPQRRTSAFLWLSAFLVLLIFVGLRHKVGMDWNNYLYMIQRANMGDVTDALKVAEPAYAFILWVSGQLGLGVYGANLVTSTIFCLGLFRYARSTSSPWMALTVAMPILVIVVAMSANRQAAAIGVILWLMADWDRYSFLRRSAYVMAAAMFHASAVLFLIFTVADARFRFVMKVILIGALLVVSFMI